MFVRMRKPRSIRPYLFAGCLALLAGCANPSSPNAIMDRIDAHRDEYEGWPFPIKDAVMSGQVLKGMDATMVFVARGSPAERVDRGARRSHTGSSGGTTSAIYA